MKSPASEAVSLRATPRMQRAGRRQDRFYTTPHFQFLSGKVFSASDGSECTTGWCGRWSATGHEIGFMSIVIEGWMNAAGTRVFAKIMEMCTTGSTNDESVQRGGKLLIEESGA